MCFTARVVCTVNDVGLDLLDVSSCEFTFIVNCFVGHRLRMNHLGFEIHD